MGWKIHPATTINFSSIVSKVLMDLLEVKLYLQRPVIFSNTFCIPYIITLKGSMITLSNYIEFSSNNVTVIIDTMRSTNFI